MATSQQVVDQIKTAVANDLKSAASRIRFFIDGAFKGGWEGWLQVESARQLMAANIAKAFDREAFYTVVNAGVESVSAQRSDLMLEPSAGGIGIYVELKTQRSNAYPNTIKDLNADIGKMKALGADTNGKYPFVAAALLKATAAPRTELNDLRTGDMSRIKIFWFSSASKTWSDTTTTIRDAVIPTGDIILATWTNNI